MAAPSRRAVQSQKKQLYKGSIRNLQESMRIICVEKLKDYILNEVRENRENEVVLRQENDKWIVYVTDERASKVTNSQGTYEDEEEALNNFIKRLRAGKILREL
ncbi:Imm59 family immunity protein [Bacillus salacetis]|nr:Imm59 family immunity protein [Bacillus salacetis]